MKALKFLLVLAVMLVVASCDSGQNPNNLPVMAKALKVQDTIAVNAGPRLDIKMYTVIIDGCQYIMGDDNGPYNGDHGAYFLTHKGNCNNPIHTHPAMVDINNHITLIPKTLK